MTPALLAALWTLPGIAMLVYGVWNPRRRNALSVAVKHEPLAFVAGSLLVIVGWPVVVVEVWRLWKRDA